MVRPTKIVRTSLNFTYLIPPRIGIPRPRDSHILTF